MWFSGLLVPNKIHNAIRVGEKKGIPVLISPRGEASPDRMCLKGEYDHSIQSCNLKSLHSLSAYNFRILDTQNHQNLYVRTQYFVQIRWLFLIYLNLLVREINRHSQLFCFLEHLTMSEKRLAVLFLDTLYSYSLITFKTHSIALFKTSSLQGSASITSIRSGYMDTNVS